MNILTPAETFLQQAIEKHRNCRKAFLSAKEHAFDAGLYLLSAQQACANGDWNDFLAAHESEIPRRTAFHYMKFATACLGWAKEANPRLIDQDKLVKAARNLVLESALEFMELCRDLGVIRSRPANGARDGKSHEPRQLSFTFNWDVFDHTLNCVTQAGSNPFVTLPPDQLSDARDRLTQALSMIDEALTAPAKKFLPLPVGDSTTEPISTAAADLSELI
ncbi:MAG: hypothetical protein SFY81_04855 [Verrucomicrobiota bacterium]|nr:hypothetical protein [Verrucomicrobiota bacterium]